MVIIERISDAKVVGRRIEQSNRIALGSESRAVGKKMGVKPALHSPGMWGRGRYYSLRPHPCGTDLLSLNGLGATYALHQSAFIDGDKMASLDFPA